MDKIIVNFDIRKTHCICCNRQLDEMEILHKTSELNLIEMMNYAPISSSQAYVDDLVEFVDIYLFDYYGGHLKEGCYVFFTQEEKQKVLDAFIDLLKSKKYEVE